MTEQLIKAIDDISGLNEIDAAELGDEISDVFIAELQRDQMVPKRSALEWHLFFARAQAPPSNASTHASSITSIAKTRSGPLSGRADQMGRASRDKGNRAERAIVHALQTAGFAAERVPLSGAARGRFGGDVSVPLLGVDRRVEVKCRGDGFRQLYAWLDGSDFLIVRADRSEPLVVLPLKLAIEIAKIAEQNK